MTMNRPWVLYVTFLGEKYAQNFDTERQANAAADAVLNNCKGRDPNIALTITMNDEEFSKYDSK